jgi:uncharacterized protein
MATVKCPHCGALLEWNESATYRPFCSERCRLIDLGAWLAEEHRVPGEPAADAPVEAAPTIEK